MTRKPNLRRKVEQLEAELAEAKEAKNETVGDPSYKPVKGQRQEATQTGKPLNTVDILNRHRKNVQEQRKR